MGFERRIPDFYAGFQRFCVSGINPVADRCKGLYFGRMRDPATDPASFDDVSEAAAPGELVHVLSPAHAAQLFGNDSQLAHACWLYFCQCGGYAGHGSLYVIPFIDEPGATCAEYTLTIDSAPTQAGTFSFQIAEEVFGAYGGFYDVPVSSTDTVDTLAANISAEINANPNAIFTASAAANVVTLIYNHCGTVGNNVSLIYNPIFGQTLPPGVGATFASSVAGAGDPDITTGLANLDSCCYNCWALLWEDPVAIELLNQEIEDRWACGKEMCFGHLFHSWTESNAADLVEYAGNFNDETRTIIPMLDTYKYPGWALAAAWAGRQCCTACSDEVGRPVVRDNGVLTCLNDSDRCGTSIFSHFEEEQMSAAGLALWGFNNSDCVFITSNVTNWKFGVTGDRDITWRNTQTRYIVPAIIGVIQRFNNEFYASSALVDDGVPIPANSRTTSPGLYQADLIAYLEGRDDEDASSAGILGLFLNEADLQDVIRVTNDIDNRAPGFGNCHRLNVEFSPRLIRQLDQIAVQFDVRPCN